MANDLYKIDVVSRYGDFNVAGGTSMLISNNTIAFVKLRPVKIEATLKTDATHVVRCGECKHWGNVECPEGLIDVRVCNELTTPPYRYFYRSKWDFCSYGERKENE